MPFIPAKKLHSWHVLENVLLFAVHLHLMIGVSVTVLCPRHVNGGKPWTMEWSHEKAKEHISRLVIFSRQILIFAMAWMGTRDIYIATGLTLIFIVYLIFSSTRIAVSAFYQMNLRNITRILMKTFRTMTILRHKRPLKSTRNRKTQKNAIVHQQNKNISYYFLFSL